jgi:hypothetical protein
MKFEMDLTKTNKNNRRYTKECLINAVAVFKEQKYHYGTIGPANDHIVDIAKSSHEVIDINVDENGIITGELKFLSTGYGALAQSYIGAEFPLSVVPRGLGKVREEDGVHVIYDYKLISMDVIAESDSSL